MVKEETEDQGMKEEESSSSSPSNDIEELMDKCTDPLSEIDGMWLLKLGLGQVSLEIIKGIIEIMGRVVIDIGDGLTLLHLAAQFGRCEWIEYLAGEAQHPLEVKTVVGETPLDQASWKGYVTASMLLIKYGADVDCQTKLGYTPLHRCAFYDHPRLASLLCLAGADRTLRDHNGDRAYDVAVKEGNDEVAQLLAPLIAQDGVDISNFMYARNNPKHPNYRPESRAALLQLFMLETAAQVAEEEGDEEEQEEGEDEDGDYGEEIDEAHDEWAALNDDSASEDYGEMEEDEEEENDDDQPPAAGPAVESEEAAP
eukprot:gene3246-3556_t